LTDGTRKVKLVCRPTHMIMQMNPENITNMARENLQYIELVMYTKE